MPLVVVGTVPYEGFPLIHAACSMEKGLLRVGAESVPVIRGTPALLAAACICAEVQGLENPQAVLAGDIGRGDGSRKAYAYLVESFGSIAERTIVFHYLQPEVDWHNRILICIQELASRPTLVADAGYMYVAKMSGFADNYDLFTPDIGEMAFLADESAPHPFYTRGFLLQEESRVPQLIERAYAHNNAARYLLVKGHKDIVACREGILGEVNEPRTESMEPIGGTGDTLTGIVSALVESGAAIPHAALSGARINRQLGVLTSPSPASSVSDLLAALPRALETAQPSEGLS